MKRIILVASITSVALAGRLGMGISGGAQQLGDYQAVTIEQLPTYYYGGEFHIQAEALPHFYLEPTVSYFNNPTYQNSSMGIGLRANIQPRLGGFPIAPFFGVEGLIMFYNDGMQVSSALNTDQIKRYLETSTPGTLGLAFAGVSLFLGKALSIDCQYRYLSLNRDFGVEMTWVGLNWYINW